MPETLDLFPDLPAPVPGNMMELVAMPGVKLSPAQRSFKQVVANIEVAEMRLKEIAALLDVFRPLFISKLRPLYDERDLLNREMAIFLDEKLLKKGWTANQRKIMRSIVCILAEQLFGSAYGDEMESIFDRHSDIKVADLAAAASAEMEADFEDLFGIEPDHSGGEARCPDEMFHEAMKQMEQRDEENAQRANSHSAKRGGKKSARQQKAEQQELDAGKLLKEVYRKLTSALHPDREPDVAERARKTALMSEVNKAYKSGNLLKLLQVQFQTVKVDSLAAASLADEKLLLINRTLRQQLQELELECHQLDFVVREEFGLSHFGVLGVPAVQKALNAAAAEHRADIKIMRRDLATIRTGDAPLKDWLKAQRVAMLDEDAFEDAFEQAMFGNSRRRR